jgi:hypothetical protein
MQDRVIEKRHGTLHAIVGLRGSNLNEFRCYKNHIRLKVLTLTYLRNQVSMSQNETFTSLQAILLIVIGEVALAFMTIGMAQETGYFPLPYTR